MSICSMPRCGCSYLPAPLIKRLATAGDARLTASMLETARAEGAAHAFRLERETPLYGRAAYLVTGKGRSIFDMAGTESPKPGRAVRSETDPATGDTSVDEAFNHSGTTYDFYAQVFGRRSLDGAGYPLTSSVRYGFMVSNAFWDGAQMVYGEGDGRYFLPFTRSLAIVAHELSHGVIAFTSKLAYQDQSGALNESFCDVMAALVVQWSRGQSVASADWTFGAEVLGPELDVPGLRTFLAEPAFQGHPFLGDDPQPKHMDQFDVTSEDYGGVHINSGIPNHAFYRAAVAFGGKAWEGVGRVWYDAFIGLGPQATFQDAADATVLQARLYAPNTPRLEAAVTAGWRAVGIEPQA